MSNYYLHRISYCWDVSKVLLDDGYLTIGWQKFYDSSLIEDIRNEGEHGFNKCMNKLKETSRSRWNLWYFINMEKGDTVVIPLDERKFAIAEIEEVARPINELPVKEITSLTKRCVKLEENGLRYADSKEIIDLGFFIKIKNIKPVSRNWAQTDLQSRMKMRQSTGNINKLQKAVEEARVATGPVNLHDKIVESTVREIEEIIEKYVNPDQFEVLVKWYLERIGATRVWNPSKNEPNKHDGADADVIAEFDALGIVIYVQAKKHEGETDDWAVEQIAMYKEQMGTVNGITYVPWVVSTAERYSDTALTKATEAKVRLIDGRQFATMLLETGIHDINEIMQRK